MSKKTRHVEWAGNCRFDGYLAPLKSVLRIRREVNSPIKTERILSLTNDRGVIPYEEKGAIGNNVSEDISRYSIVHVGDVVMNSMNVIIGSVGISKYDGALSPVYYVLQPVNKDLIDMRYFAYHFRMPTFYQQLARIGYGILEHRMRIPWINLQNELMFVPPVSEQKAIADYLDRETARIDAIIEKKQRIAILIGYRTEILLANHLDKMVKRYGEAPLKSVARLSVSNVDKKSYEGQIAVRLCNYTDVYYQRRISSKLNFMDATADFAQIQKLTLNKGDVLITKDSETPDDIAVPALVVEDLPGVVLGYHLALLRPFAILGDFLYWVVLSRRCRDAFSLAASGVTRFGLRQDAIGRVSIPAVPLNEQITLTKIFEDNVTSGDKAVELIQRQIETLREHREALITAAVTGEVEIPEAAA